MRKSLANIAKVKNGNEQLNAQVTWCEMLRN